MTPPRRRSDDDSPTALSRAELKVMKVVWKLGRPATRDVVAAAVEHGWRPSTVKTLLRRLVEKGHLRAEPVGNSLVYEPAPESRSAVERQFDAFFEQLHDEMTAPLLMHLVKRSKLSSDELAELRALLDRKSGRTR
jgi:predicted transcriptional regulator